MILDCQTWAAGSSWLCQTTVVTEEARGAGGAISQGLPASWWTNTAHRTRRWHRWTLHTVETWAQWGVRFYNMLKLTFVYLCTVYTIHVKAQVFFLITWWAGVTCGLSRWRLKSARATVGWLSTTMWARMSRRALTSCDTVTLTSNCHLLPPCLQWKQE